MKKFITKLTAVLGSGAMMLNLVTPALAVTSVTAAGNGAASDNTVDVTNTSTRTVVQNNDFTGTTTITASPNTGNNTVDGNTGGNVAVGTGNATATVQSVTQANLNQLQDNRSASNDSATLNILGNGAFSANDITATNTNTDSVFQTNVANVTNTVTANPNSGNNTITNGTGGSETLVTGHTSAAVGISTQANANVANLGGVANGGTSSTLSAAISGNGAESANTVDFSQNRLTTFVQNNDAYIDNAVDASPNSGSNTVTDNTQGMNLFGLANGGGLRIDTGNATSTVAVSSRGNINMASDGSNTTPATAAALAGNGAFSSNNLLTNLNDGLSLFQGVGQNSETVDPFTVTNAVSANPYTGTNTATDNTLNAGNSSLLVTGHAMSDTRVSDMGNANIFGPSLTLPGGMTMDFNFSLSGLFASLH